jgi:epoxide hydrolase-like predicted phosphatase
VSRTSADAALRGLIVDWGGVLTERLDLAGAGWAQSEGFDYERYIDVMADWVGPASRLQTRANPVHALERGEMTVPDFEVQLAAKLQGASAGPVQARGLLDRMFTHFEHAHAMNALVRRAHEGGVRTALLSNSWGNAYPREGWDDMFDAVVISGEVGLRKPEPEIFHLACRLIDLPPAACVFVDDMAVNVEAARSLGMVGIQHHAYEETAAELERLFGRDLA